MIDMFENILTLFITDFGLLGCLFAYIKVPKKHYFYFGLFFLFNFISEYYWTIYTLCFNESPPSSSFAAYFGWNIGYFFLLLATIEIKTKESGRYFNLLMLLPIPLNIYQYSLYIQHGGFLNNLYQVSITTITAVLCLQELLYHVTHKKQKASPHTAGITLVYLIAEYGTWTASCFSFENRFADPYLYATLLKAVVIILFAFWIQKDEPNTTAPNWAEFRFRLFYQGVISVIILILSTLCYIFVSRINIENLSKEHAQQQLTYIIFVISSILFLMILGILTVVKKRYNISSNTQQKMTAMGRAKANIIMSVIITFVVLCGAMSYNVIFMYRTGVTDIYENKKQDTAVLSEEIVHYIGRATTAVQSAASTLSYMRHGKTSNEQIKAYLSSQTQSFAMTPDNHFIDFYAYIDGTYIEGGTHPVPSGFKPKERIWYIRTKDEPHAPVIIPPYIDITTGKEVITIAKNISMQEGQEEADIICLDIEVEYIQNLLMQHQDKADTGIVINGRGDIVACTVPEYIGQNINDIYGSHLFDTINSEYIDNSILLNDTEYALNIRPMLIDLKFVMLTDKALMFSKTYARISVAILAAMISIGMVLLIYYFNYRVEEYSVLKIQNLNNQMAEALARTIDAKDTYTRGHSTRVAKYSKMIAAQAGFDEGHQENIYMMGLLHDIGKIGIPDNIINKPSGLSDEEYMLIKNHPITGDEILKSVTENPMLAKVARHHHERFDGKGYPDHLQGKEIPLEARIVAVADAYDAMTSARSYRDVMPQDQVWNEIAKGTGTQFDPEFAEIMLTLIENDKHYQMRE